MKYVIKYALAISLAMGFINYAKAAEEINVRNVIAEFTKRYTDMVTKESLIDLQNPKDTDQPIGPNDVAVLTDMYKFEIYAIQSRQNDEIIKYLDANLKKNDEIIKYLDANLKKNYEIHKTNIEIRDSSNLIINLLGVLSKNDEVISGQNNTIIRLLDKIASK